MIGLVAFVSMVVGAHPRVAVLPLEVEGTQSGLAGEVFLSQAADQPIEMASSFSVRQALSVEPKKKCGDPLRECLTRVAVRAGAEYGLHVRAWLGPRNARFRATLVSADGAVMDELEAESSRPPTESFEQHLTRALGFLFGRLDLQRRLDRSQRPPSLTPAPPTPPSVPPAAPEKPVTVVESRLAATEPAPVSLQTNQPAAQTRPARGIGIGGISVGVAMALAGGVVWGYASSSLAPHVVLVEQRPVLRSESELGFARDHQLQSQLGIGLLVGGLGLAVGSALVYLFLR